MEKDQVNYLLSCGILRKWHNKTFDDYVVDKKAKKSVLNYIRKVKEMRTEGLGIVFIGPNGTGKTHLLNCAFLEFVKLRYKVHIISLESLKAMYADGWNNLDKRERFRAITRGVDFLGIDDIGKEFRGRNADYDSATGTRPDLGLAVLDQVLRFRTQSLLPTFITMNISPDSLSDVYSVDVASLIEESCIPVFVEGGDYRSKILEKNQRLL